MYGYTPNRGPAGKSSRGKAAGDIIPKGYENGQLNQYTPEQQQIFKQQFAHLGPDSYLSRLAGGDEEAFSAMEAPAWRNFNEGLGQISSRFSEFAPGAMSARRGSGFQNQVGAYASNFAQDLASKRQELQRSAVSDLLNFSNQLLGQRPQDKFLVEKQQKQQGPALGGWGGVAGGLLGGAAGYFAGDPFAGAQIGSQAFSGL